MSNPYQDYNEKSDQSINSVDEFTGLRIEEEEKEDQTPPKKDIRSSNWSLYRSVFGNY